VCHASRDANQKNQDKSAVILSHLPARSVTDRQVPIAEGRIVAVDAVVAGGPCRVAGTTQRVPTGDWPPAVFSRPPTDDFVSVQATTPAVYAART